MQEQFDPDLRDAIQFHGHLCPGLALGYRVAKAALRELGADRPHDEELVAIVENDSCAADAVQYITGCTFGKGNLIFSDFGKHVYTFFNIDLKSVLVCAWVAIIRSPLHRRRIQCQACSCSARNTR